MYVVFNLEIREIYLKLNSPIFSRNIDLKLRIIGLLKKNRRNLIGSKLDFKKIVNKKRVVFYLLESKGR
ncbi:hypothetical protein RO3G_16185 [Rhizopus delemar RA 99-880]|uniref:Uncharacterized protein n=1 Tax=Rhizopus delemar (strain RA 99-880 / ATCC MYA-4621 / FGSC 9543 / NRRL 43880) TaxID=246409 RepID=I1CSP4_RHIO9|nr:hypothetical protein RO3G_16185 [Rhizopus delemar RA 99-880]|eukprot:EIE91474.1 hypothetical protein RO3G_16185 [Rhizopus delemar RA 99-880]